MYRKIEPKEIDQSESEAGTGARPSTPVFDESLKKTTNTADNSPFLGKVPLGYDASYHLSKGKDQSIVGRSPGGGKVARRKHEGQAHPRLKVKGITYTGSPRNKPEHEVHAIVTELVGLMERFNTDRSFIRSRGAIESNHFRYAKTDLEKVLDRILKVYLACESRLNRESYLLSLNQHILVRDFFNPFQLKLLYDKCNDRRFSEKPSQSWLEKTVSEEDIKAIIFDQLFRLKEEADKDYIFFVDHQSSLDFCSDEFSEKATETCRFAVATMKKIAEFCRYFSETETLAFFDELNTSYIDQERFYHPNTVLSLYLDNCSNYDRAKADTHCYERFSLANLQPFSSEKMRKTFCFEPVTTKKMTETIEETETFDEEGHLMTRTKKRTRTIVSSTFFSSSPKKACAGDESDSEQELSELYFDIT